MNETKKDWSEQTGEVEDAVPRVREKPIMKCGHRANALNEAGKDVCVICAGICKGYDEVAEAQPDLSKRQCKCTSCGRIVPSKNAVAFFEHRPDGEYDFDYCGCYGWD